MLAIFIMFVIWYPKYRLCTISIRNTTHIVCLENLKQIPFRIHTHTHSSRLYNDRSRRCISHAQAATIEGGTSSLLVILPKEKETRGSRKVCVAIMETLWFEFTFRNPSSPSGDYYAQRTLQPDRYFHLLTQ